MREVTVRGQGERTQRGAIGGSLAGTAAAVAVGIALGMAPQVLRADAPAGRYVLMGSTVVDTQTGLEWQASVAPATFNWTDAAAYCASLALSGGGWRLPSFTEAATLIDDSRASPALDPTAFPNTPVDLYWTGSALAAYAGVDAWTVSSENGMVTFFATAQTAHVRCVRSAGGVDGSDGVDSSGGVDGSDGVDASDGN